MALLFPQGGEQWALGTVPGRALKFTFEVVGLLIYLQPILVQGSGGLRRGVKKNWGVCFFPTPWGFSGT